MLSECVTLISKRGIGDTSCPFCEDFETAADHLLICLLFFVFDGTSIDDIWFIDVPIPLKDKLLVEFVRGTVLWTLWMEKNKLCFQQCIINSMV